MAETSPSKSSTSKTATEPLLAGQLGSPLTRGVRITGEQRDTLGATLAQRYAAGESIRAIAADTGRSYGFVHGVLKEAGVELRGRGGATRGAARLPEATSQVSTPSVADTVKGKSKKSKKAPPAKGKDSDKSDKPTKKAGKKGSKRG